MRKVVSKHEVAHFWANQTQDEARTASGNMYFDRTKIYSYGRHYILGQHVEGQTGEKAVLLNENTVSVTTTQQQTIVRRASSHLNPIFVPTIDTNGTTPYGRDVIFKAWIKEIELIGEKLLKSKKPEIYLNQIEAIKAKVDKYIFFFGFTLPDELHKLLSIESKETGFNVFTDINEQRQKMIDAAEKKRQKELKAEKKRLAELLPKWRKFESSSFYGDGTGYSYLRYNQAKNRIETSQHIEVPFEIAKRFYSYLKDTISAGGCSHCDKTFMDKYQVLQVNSLFIQVGCHKISMPEIEQIAKELNF